ncbi:uncharacterized protein LOC135497289 [Lineus longissimus]|uniref:uncharacterized protein LOC135497289 n=1 Tax=Lineus longissimus TaxID=88925 RepID=UPI00315D490F
MLKRKRSNSITALSVKTAMTGSEASTAVPLTCCELIKGDPITVRGKRIQKAKVVFFTLIPLLFLVGQNFASLVTNNTIRIHAEDIKEAVLLCTEAGNIMHYLQLERGTTAMYLGSGRSDKELKNLRASYLKTDAAINNLTRWLIIDLDSTKPYMEEKGTLQVHIYRHRLEVRRSTTTTVKEEILFYSEIIQEMTAWIADSVQKADKGTLWKTLVAYQMLTLSKEQAGIERALGAMFYASGGFTEHEVYLWYMEKYFYGKTYLARCLQYSPTCKNGYKDFKNSSLERRLMEMRAEIFINNVTSQSDVRALWFSDITKYINILKDIEHTISDEIFRALDLDVTNSMYEMMMSITILIVVVVIAPISILIVFNILSDIQYFASFLKMKSTELESEKAQTTKLLNQMLPKFVVEKLKRKQIVQPEKFDGVSVLFSDITGFADFALECDPLQIVEILNSLYRVFDETIDRYSFVFKAQIVGDSYIACAGCPIRYEGHAKEIATLALDLMVAMKSSSNPYKGIIDAEEDNLKLRIAVHSGSCVAGVVGFTMPRYCLFGDVINTTPFLLRTGLANKIHISRPAYVLLKHTNAFELEERGVTEISGKGKILTYWLKGNKVPVKI